MNPKVTILVTHRNGRVEEINTKEYPSAEAAFQAFVSIHKQSILEEGWVVEVKK